MSENIRLIDSENEKTLGVSGDVLPSAHKYATFFKKYLRKRMRQSGFRRITTSGIEPVGIGESVLNKENICTISKTQALRSCSPTSIMRSYLENDMKEWVQPVQLYHLQEMFRKEGDMISSYYEYGFEIIGQKDPVIAAE
ncbi:MAG: hypothetical protein U9Q15_02355 [Patescibacteria group bacterium]|nr:hypothetical protein [Patescibacteria group bacterium]